MAWRFAALVAICEGKPVVNGGFPSQRASNADVFFDAHQNKRLNKQWDCRDLRFRDAHAGVTWRERNLLGTSPYVFRYEYNNFIWCMQQRLSMSIGGRFYYHFMWVFSIAIYLSWKLLLPQPRFAQFWTRHNGTVAAWAKLSSDPVWNYKKWYTYRLAITREKSVVK